MSNIFFTSDSHFGHANILKFTDSKTGLRIRPEFETVKEMDEFMIQKWNEVVKDGDKIYHLGDIAFHETVLVNVMPRLNGSKRLLLGNHDPDPLICRKFFKKVQLWRLFKEHNFLACHVPIHESGLYKVRFNVHGHIHQNDEPTPRHINISVEKTGYRPLHIDEISAIIKTRMESGQAGNAAPC